MGKKKKKTSALTRQMLKSIVQSLEWADPEQWPEDREDFIRGQQEAAQMIREAFILDEPTSHHDQVIGAASAALALDDGTGRGVGWLEVIWDTGFKEGQLHPSITLMRRIRRWYS